MICKFELMHGSRKFFFNCPEKHKKSHLFSFKFVTARKVKGVTLQKNAVFRNPNRN